MIVIYETCQPIWIVRIQDRISGDDLASLSGMIRRMHEFPKSLLLVDALEAGMPDVSVRRGLGELTVEHEGKGRDRTAGVALMIKSGALSGAVRAVLWFVPSLEKDLVKVSPDLEGALAHLEARAPELVTASLKRRVNRALYRDAPPGDAAG